MIFIGSSIDCAYFRNARSSSRSLYFLRFSLSSLGMKEHVSFNEKQIINTRFLDRFMARMLQSEVHSYYSSIVPYYGIEVDNKSNKIYTRDRNRASIYQS